MHACRQAGSLTTDVIVVSHVCRRTLLSLLRHARYLLKYHYLSTSDDGKPWGMLLHRSTHVRWVCCCCRSAGQVQLYTDLWLHEVLLPQDNLVAAGLAYHMCDLLLPELAAVCSSSGSGGASAAPQQTTLLALLEPFCQALARTRDPALVYRLR